jgi:O-antigen ligase
VGVALTPLVSIGTVKLSIRLIPSDWIFLGVAIVALTIAPLRSAAVSDSSRALALTSTIGLTVVAGASLIAGLTLWTDPNLAALPLADTLVDNIGSPGLRGAVEELRLVQGLACLFAILAVVHTRRSWIAVATTVAVSAAVVSVYGVYQVGGEILLGSVPQPPWAYQTDGLRAGGTFPEPTAFAGFLIFGAGCAACVLELRRRAWMAVVLLLIIGGIVASRSTVGLVGIGVLAVALLCFLRLRAAAVILVAALALGGLGLAFRDDARVREAYAKPFGVSESVLDREAVWGAALRMGATYAPAGVGRGQFAYNQAPFVDPSQADRGGRANSAILELWSEAGPVGIFFALSALAVGPIFLLRRREHDRFRVLHGDDGGLLLARSRPPSVPWASRMVVWALFLSLLAVLALYYTTSFIWIWLAMGLLATAPTALRDRGIPFPESMLTDDRDALAAGGEENGRAATRSSHVVASGFGGR